MEWPNGQMGKWANGEMGEGFPRCARRFPQDCSSFLFLLGGSEIRPGSGREAKRRAMRERYSTHVQTG